MTAHVASLILADLADILGREQQAKDAESARPLVGRPVIPLYGRVAYESIGQAARLCRTSPSTIRREFGRSWFRATPLLLRRLEAGGWAAVLDMTPRGVRARPDWGKRAG